MSNNSSRSNPPCTHLPVQGGTMPWLTAPTHIAADGHLTAELVSQRPTDSLVSLLLSTTSLSARMDPLSPCRAAYRARAGPTAESVARPRRDYNCSGRSNNHEDRYSFLLAVLDDAIAIMEQTATTTRQASHISGGNAGTNGESLSVQPQSTQ